MRRPVSGRPSVDQLRLVFRRRAVQQSLLSRNSAVQLDRGGLLLLGVRQVASHVAHSWNNLDIIMVITVIVIVLHSNFKIILNLTGCLFNISGGDSSCLASSGSYGSLMGKCAAF